ncbi:hypothetical protein R6Q57_021351 [Mikania cordata]
MVKDRTFNAKLFWVVLGANGWFVRMTLIHTNGMMRTYTLILVIHSCEWFEVSEGSSRFDDCVVKLDEKDDIFGFEWLGIETLEKSFGAVVAFMDFKSSGDCAKLTDNEVSMQFYGLQIVTIDEYCFELQPMALRVSACTK